METETWYFDIQYNILSCTANNVCLIFLASSPVPWEVMMLSNQIMTFGEDNFTIKLSSSTWQTREGLIQNSTLIRIQQHEKRACVNEEMINRAISLKEDLKWKMNLWDEKVGGGSSGGKSSKWKQDPGKGQLARTEGTVEAKRPHKEASREIKTSSVSFTGKWNTQQRGVPG